MVSSKVSKFVLFTRCQASIITISAEVLCKLWGFQEKKDKKKKKRRITFTKITGQKIFDPRLNANCEHQESPQETTEKDQQKSGGLSFAIAKQKGGIL